MLFSDKDCIIKVIMTHFSCMYPGSGLTKEEFNQFWIDYFREDVPALPTSPGDLSINHHEIMMEKNPKLFQNLFRTTIHSGKLPVDLKNINKELGNSKAIQQQQQQKNEDWKNMSLLERMSVEPLSQDQILINRKGYGVDQ